MLESLEQFDKLPVDDVGIEYARADEVTQTIVSALLSIDDIRFMVSVIDMDALTAYYNDPNPKKHKNVNGGFAVFKSDAETVPVLVSNALSPFLRTEVSHEASVAIASWLARAGRKTLEVVYDKAEEMMEDE